MRDPKTLRRSVSALPDRRILISEESGIEYLCEESVGAISSFFFPRTLMSGRFATPTNILRR